MSWLVYNRNKTYYAGAAIIAFGVNILLTPALYLSQPFWLVVVCVGTNIALINWTIALHKDSRIQMEQIKSIARQYPQSFDVSML